MLSCVGPISRIARSKARAVSSAMRAGLFTCAWYFVIFEKIGELLGLLEAAQADRQAARSRA